MNSTQKEKTSTPNSGKKKLTLYNRRLELFLSSTEKIFLKIAISSYNENES